MPEPLWKASNNYYPNQFLDDFMAAIRIKKELNNLGNMLKKSC
jgi:hypothetical protein